MPTLSIRSPKGDRQVEITEPLILGRDESATLRIDDHRCSRQHARLERKSGRWRLVDLGSANGTFVNGNSVTQRVLEDGDVIEIGDYEIEFLVAAPSVRAAASTPAPSDSGASLNRRSANKSRLPMMLGAAALLLAAIFLWKPWADDQASTGIGGEQASAGSDVDADNPDAGSETAQGSEGESGERAEPKEDLDAAVLTALSKLETSAEQYSLDDLAFELDELEKSAVGVETKSRIATTRDNLVARVESRFRDALKTAVAAAQTEAEAGRFAAALDQLDSFIEEAEVAGAATLRLDARRRRLTYLKSARADWERVLAGLDDEGLTYDTRRAALEKRLPDYRGTNFEALARAELRRLELRQIVAAKVPESSGESSAGSGATAAGAGRATPNKHRGLSEAARAALDSVSKAEQKAAERDWRTAASLYDQALDTVDDKKLSAAWSLRRDVLQSYHRLKIAVIVAVNAETREMRSVRIGRLTAAPYAADDDKLELKFGRSGIVTWTWKEITAERMIEFFAKAAKDPEDKLHFARVAFDLGRVERAEAMLARVVRRPGFKDRADRLVAAVREVELPIGGFVVHEKRFLTPEEFAAIELRAEAEKYAREMKLATPRRFEDLVATLNAMGATGRRALITGLEARLGARVDRARTSGVFKKPGGTRRELSALLDERREVAFKLILDDDAYPYPYVSNQAEIQAKVDGLVDRVREVWVDPASAMKEKNEKWQETMKEIEDLEGRLLELGREPKQIEALVRDLNLVIDIQNHDWSSSEKKKIDEVMKFNARIKSSITAEEREVHKLTNEYRMLMGLLPVKIDEALVLAARGHSQEMKDLGYFAHDSPTPGRQKPSQRAQLAGWGGGVSENIARGQQSPAGAVNGWIGSSGHHRNILGRRHTHLGCGKAKDGAFWTQNFGTGASSSISKETIKEGE